MGRHVASQHAAAFYVALGSTIDKVEQLMGTQSSTTSIKDAVQKMADEKMKESMKVPKTNLSQP